MHVRKARRMENPGRKLAGEGRSERKGTIIGGRRIMDKRWVGRGGDGESQEK